MQRKLKGLASLSPCDWVILIQLVAAAVFLEIVLRLVALPRLVHTLAWGANTRLGAAFPLCHRRTEPDHLCTLASFAARIVHGPECCLSRSLLVFWLLRLRREPVVLLIGVRKDTKRLHSHAWIETPSMIRNEVHNHGRAFLPLLRFSNETV